MNKKTSSKLNSHKAPASGSKASPKAVKKTKAASKKLAQEHIALRAYFISEERQRTGRDGNHLSDWMEAERQLMREAEGNVAASHSVH